MSYAQTFGLRRQGLTVLTTEGCNFACVYCHQPHDPHHMGAETIEAIANFVRRKADQIDNLDVSWFGGEPLINLKAVLELGRELRCICEHHGIVLQGFMSTNAYLLTPDLFVRLLDLSIARYQITFDGPEDVHNRYRLAVNGKPTFTTLWNHICAFREVARDFEVLIRVHVTPVTIEAVRGFVEQLRVEFGEDSRFKIAIANVAHWGGPHDASIPVFRDAAPVLRSLSERVPAANQIVEGNAICSAANPSHLVVRPNGTVVKCAHSLDLEENQIGHLTRAGEFVYRPGTVDRWLRGLVSGDRRALECPRDGIEKLHSPRSLVRHTGSRMTGSGN